MTVDWDRLDRETFADGGPINEAPVRPRAPRIVRQRPSARYDSPEELWAWHWARMRVVAAWGAVVPLVTISGTTAVIFFSELIW